MKKCILTKSLKSLTYERLRCLDRASNCCKTSLSYLFTLPSQFNDSNGICKSGAPSKCGGVAQVAPRRSFKENFYYKFEFPFKFIHSVYTRDNTVELDSHSANGFIEQSQAKGLSCNDRLRSCWAPSSAFRATIEMSLPSRRNSFSDGSGRIKSDVNDLHTTKH